MSEMVSRRWLKDLEKVQNLSHTQNCYIAWDEDSGAEVWNIWDEYFLFEAPLLGKPRFVGVFAKDQLPSLVIEAYSWT